MGCVVRLRVTNEAAVRLSARGGDRVEAGGSASRLTYVVRGRSPSWGASEPRPSVLWRMGLSAGMLEEPYDTADAFSPKSKQLERGREQGSKLRQEKKAIAPFILYCLLEGTCQLCRMLLVTQMVQCGRGLYKDAIPGGSGDRLEGRLPHMRGNLDKHVSMKYTF